MTSRPLQELALHARRLFTRPREELTVWQRSLVFAARLARHCASELRRDKAHQIAAALTYHTLFSLVPMLVLVFLVFQSVQGLEPYRDRFETLLVEVLLPESVVGARSPTGTLPGLETGAETGIDARVEFEEARQVMRGRFDDFLAEVAELNLAGIGIVGVLVFLYGATSLLSTVEGCFDTIYRAESKRPFTRRLPLYFTLMTIGPLVLVGSQIAQDRTVARLAASESTRWLTLPLGGILPFMATWIFVFVAFRGVPNTRVSWRSAAIGSFVSALLWLTLQEIFGIYMDSTIITSLYGALALVPLLLLWAYLSWLVALFGLEVSYSLQFLREEDLLGEVLRPSLTGDPRWILPIVAAIASRFREGEPAYRRDLARNTGLPPDILDPYLARLIENGLVHEVELNQKDRKAFSLSRPPNTIRLQEVLDLGGPAPTREGAAWELLRDLDEEDSEVLGERTLADLLGS